MLKNIYRLTIASFLTCTLPIAVAHANLLDRTSEFEIGIEANDGTEITAAHYPAQGNTLIIWIGSSYNFSKRAFKTAHLLAEKGLEIWQVDFSEIFFEPKTSNFMRNLDGQYVADLIAAAHKKTGKQIILLSRAYGAIPTMRGAALWQQQYPGKKYLNGAILFSPDFFTSVPELGLDPDYLPITTQTTLPMFIYQGARRGTAWQFPRLLKKLGQSNQHIYFSYMQGIAGVFYRNDHDPATIKMLKQIPRLISDTARLLQQTSGYQRPNKYSQNTLKRYNARLNSQIKPFIGQSTPIPFSLKDSNDQLITRNQFKHKVTVVNFWATWCPPCVEEIPSLNRLRKKMKALNSKQHDFELISINYAESKQTVDSFLKKINVEFPVLLDIDGAVSKKWNVVAFPSTFVIGPDGKIHYGINAAIRWDSPDAIELLNSLY